MKRSKKYRESEKLVDREKVHTALEAAALAKKTTTVKFDATIEVSMALGVDPKKADQMVRGTVLLPHGTGKTARVIVFANADKAAEARAAGADEVGSDDLIEKVAGGYTDYDAVVSTPDLMGKVGRLGKVLGPRGLMPNPKTGTVTMDVAKAVTDQEEIKQNLIEQLTGPVRWTQTINAMIHDGATSFTEVGPGKVLQGLIAKINKEIPAVSIN